MQHAFNELQIVSTHTHTHLFQFGIHQKHDSFVYLVKMLPLFCLHSSLDKNSLAVEFLCSIKFYFQIWNVPCAKFALCVCFFLFLVLFFISSGSKCGENHEQQQKNDANSVICNRANEKNKSASLYGNKRLTFVKFCCIFPCWSV